MPGGGRRPDGDQRDAREAGPRREGVQRPATGDHRQAARLPVSVRRPEVRGRLEHPSRHLQKDGRGRGSGPGLLGSLRDLAQPAHGHRCFQGRRRLQ
eukprot:7392871-Heterocapsa_arctica.AAC.1